MKICLLVVEENKIRKFTVNSCKTEKKNNHTPGEPDFCSLFTSESEEAEETTT